MHILIVFDELHFLPISESVKNFKIEKLKLKPIVHRNNYQALEKSFGGHTL